ncbi:MAG TPA: RNA 3'-terminal phosphate cyclase [Steroidobacteraceae bacterium]|jgi:RNA 3'-terminal phosphate cyclase (ATP)
MIEIDASIGEGGGQVVRTALTLAACCGTPVRLFRMRERREKPGLRAQHLAAVRAAAAICDARVSGATVGSTELAFAPGRTRPGRYEIDVGTAGSTMLVLQTLLPALSFCAGPSMLVLRGGTHNPRAPTFEFVRDAYLPLIGRLGFRARIELEAYGFFPRGGGLVRATIEPLVRGRVLDLLDRGRVASRCATALCSRLPEHVARRELATLRERLGLAEHECRALHVGAPGAGNVLQLRVDCEHVTTVFSSFGMRGRPAEQVAAELAGEALRYLSASAAVDGRLADQLLLPMALTAGGAFSTLPVTLHTETNAAIIRRFLPVAYNAVPAGEDKWLIGVGGNAGSATRISPRADLSGSARGVASRIS